MKIKNKKKPDLGNGWDELVEKLAREIFDTREAGRLIEPEMVRRHSEIIMDAVKEGFGFDYETDTPNTNALKTIENLQRNVYHFSGAKNWNQIQEMSALLVGNDTQPISFNQFLKAVKQIDATYNQTYLQSEYQYAQASAQMSAKWNQFQQEKEALPFLEYVAVMDERTRDEHARLNGTVRHIDDPFWKKYYPPNGWRCRCTVRQLDEPDAEGRHLEPLPKLPPLPPFFNNNVGETNAVFSEKHPYFETIPKKVLKDVFIASEKLMPKPERIVEQATYKLPRKEQFRQTYENKKSGGKVFEHSLVKKQADYVALNQYAKMKTETAKVVELLPEINAKETSARKRILKNYSNKTSNPDLRIDGKFWELKRSSVRNLKGRFDKAITQSNNIAFFMAEKISFKQMVAFAQSRFNDSSAVRIDFVVDGKLFPFQKKPAS